MDLAVSARLPKKPKLKASPLDRYDPENKRAEIETRLAHFKSVPKSKWNREVLFCLFTPQSNPFNAEASLVKLEQGGLFEGELTERQVAKILRTPSHYVRFHNVKAKRVIAFLGLLPDVTKLLHASLSPFEEREELIRMINGFGYKEASHALRNIGRSGLTILDRHILRCLQELGVLKAIPRTLTNSNYKTIEQQFLEFADSVGEAVDFLDLLFWSNGTGKIFK